MRQHASPARNIALAAGVAAGLVAGAARADGPGPRRDETVAVVDRVKGAVVNIHSERTVSSPEDPFRAAVQPQRVNGMGTGIVLDPRGYIVTNFHVVDDVQSLRVRLVDGATCPARVLAQDKEADLAVIKVDPPRPLPTAPLGTAQDLLLAERVIAIGNAYGYEHTVTVGHVSAMKRDVTLNKEISYKSLIQTQTPINPGNSGGPLFNKLGEVVGVNVAIRAGAQNIAFAIPVDTMIARAADMLSARRRAGVAHGLAAVDRYSRDAEDGPVRRWVAAGRVDPDSPAGRAGVRPGDVVEQVGDLAVRTSIDVERALLDRPAGGVPVRVRRGADGEVLTLTLALQPVARAQGPDDEVWRRVGVRVVPVKPEAVAAVNPQLRGGLLVADLAAGGAAARAGLQRGDVLIGLHLWEALTPDNLVFVLTHKDAATFTPVKVYFARAGRMQETLLVPAE